MASSTNNLALYTIKLLLSNWEDLINKFDILPTEGLDQEEVNIRDSKTITIVQPTNYNFKIKLITLNDNKEYTKTTTLPYRTPFICKIVGDNPAGMYLNTDAGVVTDNITIRAYNPDDIDKTCVVILLQDSPYQTIYANFNGKGFTNTNSTFVTRGDSATFTVISNDERKYEVGRLNMTSLDNIQKNINYVYATAAKLRDDWDSNSVLVSIQQTPHQVVEVWLNGVKHIADFIAKKGDDISVTVRPEDGYTAGTANYSSLTLSTDVVIYATSAQVIYKPPEKKKYSIVINNPSPKNQTIYININGKRYSSTVNNLDEGTAWTATIEPVSDDYLEGILTNVGGILNGNTTVSASAAKYRRYSFNIGIGSLTRTKTGWSAPIYGYENWSWAYSSSGVFNHLQKQYTGSITPQQLLDGVETNSTGSTFALFFNGDQSQCTAFDYRIYFKDGSAYTERGCTRIATSTSDWVCKDASITKAVFQKFQIYMNQNCTLKIF